MINQLNNTAHKVLDVAEFYTQTRGFNAFSYKDIQQDVGVKTSSIHYYFPTKHDLASAMTQRYIERFSEQLTQIDLENEKGIARLTALNKIYIAVLKQGKFCLCGMLASDLLSLPQEVNDQLKQFFSLIENWINTSLALSQSQGDFDDNVDLEAAGSLYFAALEGGMLIARAKNDAKYFEIVMREVIERLER